MIEKDLDKVLNYMKQYVENKYEHDSEPMLTWKDLKLVLNEINRLNNIINELEKHLQNEISKGRSEDNVWLMGCYDEDREILDKLQELKGSSNNE